MPFADRSLLSCLALCGVLAIAGCGGGDDSEPVGEPELAVYVSAPLAGPDADAGSSIVEGAERALADAGGEAGGVAVRAVALDSTGGVQRGSDLEPVVVAENARTATRDSTTIAYIGDFSSAATSTSLPITNQAGILQVSPASTAPELVEDRPGTAGLTYQPSDRRTFGRVIPEGEKNPGPYGDYGYEAMAVVLDSIERATDPQDRSAVIEAFFATTDRDSVLGTYSIDEEGNTTLGTGG